MKNSRKCSANYNPSYPPYTKCPHLRSGATTDGAVYSHLRFMQYSTSLFVPESKASFAFRHFICFKKVTPSGLAGGGIMQHLLQTRGIYRGISQRPAKAACIIQVGVSETEISPYSPGPGTASTAGCLRARHRPDAESRCHMEVLMQSVSTGCCNKAKNKASHPFQDSKKSPEPCGSGDSFGGRYRTRTCDPLHVKQVL